MKVKALGSVLAKRFGVEAAQELVPWHPTLGDVDSAQALAGLPGGQEGPQGRVVEAMSQRDGYGPGVPCWVDTWQPDLDAAVAFYARLFGWEAEETRPPEDAGRYAVCRLRGREVAGIGTLAVEGAPPGAAWGHTVQVDDAGEAARHATAAGGSVVTPPLQSFDGGRTAVLADPSGAVLTVWQPAAIAGPGWSTSPGRGP
jgi:predicted enzyme related to lactoylglutathione lyase